MCRSIKTLRTAAGTATEEEIEAAALQFVRKVSGFREPSRANADAFNAAVAETQSFGLPFAAAATAATIVTELAGSALILTGLYRWLGALWLAGFTLFATFVANRFWEMQPPQRFMVENSFFEHLGLIGGFLLVAWLDLRKRQGASL